MLKAIAIDDEPPALDIVKTYCQQLESIELIRTFTGTGKALDYIESFPVDLVFLDINMPAMSGLEFYKKVPSPTMVIFTTSYSEYAVESYNLNAVDYLLKPYTFSRFQQAIEKAQRTYQYQHLSDQQPFLLLRVDYGLIRVTLDDILFIEGLDNYLKIHLTRQAPLIVRMTMKLLQDKLPVTDFMRVHRSYIVALPKIDSVRNKMVYIGQEEIPLGSSYEKQFFSVYQRQ